MLILSLILFAVVLAVLAYAGARDLSNLEEVDPTTADGDAPVIRIAG